MKDTVDIQRDILDVVYMYTLKLPFVLHNAFLVVFLSAMSYENE